MFEATFELKVRKLEPSQPKEACKSFCWLFPSLLGRGTGNRAKQIVGMEKGEYVLCGGGLQAESLLLILVRFIKVIVYGIEPLGS